MQGTNLYDASSAVDITTNRPSLIPSRNSANSAPSGQEIVLMRFTEVLVYKTTGKAETGDYLN